MTGSHFSRRRLTGGARLNDHSFSLSQIRAAIVDGQQAGAFRADLNATPVAKMFFGALDEMATNWILSRRHSLEADADLVVDLFLRGARVR